MAQNKSSQSTSTRFEFLAHHRANATSRDKEAHPEPTSLSLPSHAAGRKNGPSPTIRANTSKSAARIQTMIDLRLRTLERHFGSFSPSMRQSRPRIAVVGPSSRLAKAELPPAPRRSPRETIGEAPLPLLLDVKFGGAQPRGTKRSAATANIDEVPNEDQSLDRELGSRKVITRRTARFGFLASSRPGQRRRVGDDLETPEAAPDELWVAVGEDRCKPCKLVGREVCKPQWNGSEPCKSCVFCKGQTWSCNPPDSWVGKMASVLHPKQAPLKSQEFPTDDAPYEEEGGSKTAKAAPPTAKVAADRHQSGRQKGTKLRATLDHEVCNLKYEAELLELDRVGKVELQDVASRIRGIKVMLVALCNHLGITVPGSDAAAAATTTHSTNPAPVTVQSHAPTTEVAVGRHQCGRKKGTKVAQATLDHEVCNLRLEAQLLAYRQQMQEDLRIMAREVHVIEIMVMALCNHLGVTPSLVPGFNAAVATTSTHCTIPTSVTDQSHVPQCTSMDSDAGAKDEEPSQEGISAASQLSSNGHNLEARVVALEGRMDVFEEWMKGVDHRLKGAGL